MDSPQQIASDLQIRIANLTTFEGDFLRHEMEATKKTLLENPAACVLLLDEDIGMCVAGLRKITGIAMANAAKPKKEKKDKPIKLSEEDMADGIAGM